MDVLSVVFAASRQFFEADGQKFVLFDTQVFGAGQFPEIAAIGLDQDGQPNGPMTRSVYRVCPGGIAATREEAPDGGLEKYLVSSAYEGVLVLPRYIGPGETWDQTFNGNAFYYPPAGGDGGMQTGQFVQRVSFSLNDAGTEAEWMDEYTEIYGSGPAVTYLKRFRFAADGLRKFTDFRWGKNQVVKTAQRSS